jgi:hypothetical protein
LNDPQLVEAARHLGRRILTEGGAGDVERARWGFRLVTGRVPGEAECAILARLLGEQREIFAANRDAAIELLSVGESHCDASVDPTELAAATVLAQAIMNHDLALLRR